jgi:hypothetical protein
MKSVSMMDASAACTNGFLLKSLIINSLTELTTSSGPNCHSSLCATSLI